MMCSGPPHSLHRMWQTPHDWEARTAACCLNCLMAAGAGDRHAAADAGAAAQRGIHRGRLAAAR